MTFNLEKIARQFFKIERWHGATPLGAGNINDTYRIDFQAIGQRQSAVLQRLNHEVFRDPQAVMDNAEVVAQHLTKTNFPLKIPAPLPTLDGQMLHVAREGLRPETHSPQVSDLPTKTYWRAFPFFENTYAPETAATPEIAHEAAKAYGQFLRHLANCQSPIAEVIPGFHDSDKRWISFLEILEKDPADRRKLAEKEIAQLLELESIFLKISHLKTSGQLPERLTHNDTKAGNILLDCATNRAVAVIDWDTVMPGTVLSDYGDMVRTFAPDRPETADPAREKIALRTDILAALTEGFLAETAAFLTPAERENLPLGGQWLVAEQALRFLADYLAGDPYFKIEYPEQNLVRARNQLAVSQLLA